MKVLCDSDKIWFLKPNASLVSAVSVFDSRSRSLGFEVQVGPKCCWVFEEHVKPSLSVEMNMTWEISALKYN